MHVIPKVSSRWNKCACTTGKDCPSSQVRKPRLVMVMRLRIVNRQYSWPFAEPSTFFQLGRDRPVISTQFDTTPPRALLAPARMKLFQSPAILIKQTTRITRQVTSKFVLRRLINIDDDDERGFESEVKPPEEGGFEATWTSMSMSWTGFLTPMHGSPPFFPRRR
ncbi:hypothetical protein SCHPADRAFT_266071 [Schizopora paradoxa]|uniref:Uncharacterized protein n=1 Tax=Schizopora paradoxa TaxID=27342 RepID=A0A0H2RUW7_9AGAM|nr:hypothetical protein SCHPADRAFT_266071 [Schizopora paradoxa]